MRDRIDATVWRLRNITRMVQARREMRDGLTALAFGVVGLLILAIAENVR